MDVTIGGTRTRSKDFVSMEYSFQQLDRFIKEFVKGTEYDTAAAVKYTARELGIRIVDKMPYRTGRAAAGWSAAGRALNFSVPNSAASRSGDSGYGEIMTGSAPRITFVNNVDYVLFLEYGWSAQAPLGMVRISVAEMMSNGTLPALLAKSYEDRWEGMEHGMDRYSKQASILGRGLGKVRTIVPSRRSVAARVSNQLRARTKSHVSTKVLSNIQKSFSESAKTRTPRKRRR